MKKEYCVYVHTNKINGKKYVGITCRKPSKRWKAGSAYRNNPYFYNAIQKYGWDGFTHDVIMSGLSRQSACEWERFYIKHWDTTNKKNGYNISLGGEGVLSVSDETRKKQSASAKRRYENPEEIQKNRERGLKMFSTQEAIEKDRLAQLKYHKENPEARYRRARKVNQYDLEGHFLCQWKSIKDAATAVGCSEHGIRNCCLLSYGSKSAKGYMWRFSTDVDPNKDIEPVQRFDSRKSINQYSLEGKFIKQWDGITDAEDALHTNNISEVCNGRRESAAGFMWRFTSEENRTQIEPHRRCRNELQNQAI